MPVEDVVFKRPTLPSFSVVSEFQGRRQNKKPIAEVRGFLLVISGNLKGIIFSYFSIRPYLSLFAETIVKILEENPNQKIGKYKMKQICVFLLFVTAVLGKPRDKSKCRSFNVIFC